MKGAVGYIGVFLSFLCDVFGSQLPFACGTNHPLCPDYCSFCQVNFPGPRPMDCLSIFIDNICLPEFTTPLRLLNTTDWCNWDKVGSLYSNFSSCTEEISECLKIPWPNSLVEKLFVNIHSEFFKTCPTEEFSDPEPAIIFALVITPICLIPVMVSLVVLKTKNGDGTS